jgi:ACS family allantoate permease-like MFS transporter
MWKVQYQPRNHIPWAMLTMGSVLSAILLVIIRFVLVAENKRRDAANETSEKHAYVVDIDEHGNRVEKQIDVVSGAKSQCCCSLKLMLANFQAFLDLTDRQNKDFRYVL